jgi:glutathione peroxidase-family protein
MSQTLNAAFAWLVYRYLQEQSRSRKFGQDDKWNFCLTAAIIAVNRRNHEQTTPAEPLTGLQDPMGRWIATGALTE